MKPELNLNRSLCIMVLIFSCLVSCTDYATAEFTTEDLDDAIAAMNKKGENTLGLEILQNYQSMDTGFYSVYTKESITNMKGTFSEVNEAIIKFSNTIQPGMYFGQSSYGLGVFCTYMINITKERVFYIKILFSESYIGERKYHTVFDADISRSLLYNYTDNGDLLTNSGIVLRPFKDDKGLTVGFTNPDGIIDGGSYKLEQGDFFKYKGPDEDYENSRDIIPFLTSGIFFDSPPTESTSKSMYFRYKEYYSKHLKKSHEDSLSNWLYDNAD